MNLKKLSSGFLQNTIALPSLLSTLNLVFGMSSISFLLLFVLVVNVFINRNQTYFSRIFSPKNPILYLALFYLLYCVGMFYTSDLKEGIKDEDDFPKLEDLEIPEEWKKIIEKEDGSWKKIIFYNFINETIS